MKLRLATLTCLLAVSASNIAAGAKDAKAERNKPPTSAMVLESAQAADWRRPDPENTLYLDLPSGRVIINATPQSVAH